MVMQAWAMKKCSRSNDSIRGETSEVYRQGFSLLSVQLCFLYYKLKKAFLFGGIMENLSKTEIAVSLLRNKAEMLKRLPMKSDFSDSEVCFIKQKLGPWPRALEAAGLKKAPEVSAAEKSRLKRERSKKLRKQRNKSMNKNLSETDRRKNDEEEN